MRHSREGKAAAATGQCLTDGADQLPLAHAESELEKAHSTTLQARLCCKECETEVSSIYISLGWRNLCDVTFE